MPHIAAEMQQLAEALAETSPSLDFTPDSLKSLEKLAQHKPRTAAHTRACGAYLGETMRRQAPDTLKWVSLAEAAKANAVIAKLTPGPDLDALLQAGETFFFPLSKVEKFQAQGASESLGPFASVALATLPGRRFTPAQDEAERVRLAEAAARVDAAMEAFRAAPSAASMAHLERMIFGHVARRDMQKSFARLGLDPAALLPFLDVPPEGRGYKRTDHGGSAACLLMQLLQQGAVPKEPTVSALRAVLLGPSKDARRNAAEVLAYCDLSEGNTEVLLTLTASRDRQIVLGALTGLRSVTADWRMDYATPKLSMAPLAPMLTKMLAPQSPHLGIALGIARTWGWHRAQRHELAWLTDALLPLLDHPKPDTAKQASATLTTYLLAILHGHAPRNEAFEAELRKREDGFGGPTLDKLHAK